MSMNRQRSIVFLRRPRARLLAAATVCVIAVGCGAGLPQMIRPEEASYCPCAKEPKCPVEGSEECTLRDVQRQQPSLLEFVRRCDQYYVVWQPTDRSVDYVFDMSTGRRVASVEFSGDEAYEALPDGRLRPACRCLGPHDLRVGSAVADRNRCEDPDPAALVKLGLNPDGVGRRLRAQGRPRLRRGPTLAS